MDRNSAAPPRFHVMAKPRGAICNLDCEYCFFLAKEMLYPDSNFRMSHDLLETYIRQLLESHQTREVTVAWQGGEPTLMGLDFFRLAMQYVDKYKKPGMIIENTIQTNGTLLDDEWGEFLHANNFLVGISIDGPRELHDRYRYDKGGKPTFDKVMRGIRLLQEHKVEFNTLTTINRLNADYPLEVYRFLRDEVGTTWMQFIPIVERINSDGLTLLQEGTTVTDRSVRAEQYGNFLITTFDEWVHRDVGTIFVQTFEAAVRSWMGLPSGMCIFSPTCGNALAIEHNGDLYSCDHFVEPRYLLGNIQKTHMIELVASDQQRNFGRDKLTTLPRYCLECEVRFACHGECPKNRFIETPDGEAGLNYLCAGLKAFFNHIDYPMQVMTALLKHKQPAAGVMRILAEQEAAQAAAFAKAGRNDPCPCGGGRKFKHCHGR